MKRMKSLVALVALTALVAMFHSCAKESEQHLLQMVHPSNSIVFADQTRDSVEFYTFDSWKVVPDDTEWIQVEGENSARVNDQDQLLRLYILPVSIQPNTTGKTRLGYLRVTSYEFTAYASYIQVGFLRITRPAYEIKTLISEYSSIPSEVSFCLKDSSTFTLDSLSFTTYNPWTLQPDASASWLTLSRTEGEAGHNLVELYMKENETKSSREAKLKLTSGEVTNEIIVRQSGRKD